MFSSLSLKLLVTTSLYLLTVVDAAPPSKRQSDNGACQQLTTNCINAVDKSLNNVFAIESCVLGASCFNGQRPVDNFLAFVSAAKNGNGVPPPQSVGLPRVTSAVMNGISTNAKFISRQNYIDAFYGQLSLTNGPWPSSADVVINYFERLAVWTAFCAGDIPFRNFQDYFQYSATVSSPGCGQVTSSFITITQSTASPIPTVSVSTGQSITPRPTSVGHSTVTISASTVVPSGPVTVSSQVPSGPVSSSTQVPSGPVTVSSQVPSGPATSSTQVPSGPVTVTPSAPSTQVPSGPVTITPSAPSTQVPSGPVTVTSSASSTFVSATTSTISLPGSVTSSVISSSASGSVTSSVITVSASSSASVTPSTIITIPGGTSSSISSSGSVTSPTASSSATVTSFTLSPIPSSSASATSFTLSPVPSSSATSFTLSPIPSSSATSQPIPPSSAPSTTISAPPPTGTPPTLSSDATCQQMFFTCTAQVNAAVTNLWSIKACVLGAACVDGAHPVGTFASAVHTWKQGGSPPTAPVNQPRVSTALFQAGSTDGGKTWSQQNFIDAYYSQLSSTNGPFPPNANKVIEYYKRIAAWTGFCGKAIPYMNFADYFQWSATVDGPATTC